VKFAASVLKSPQSLLLLTLKILCLEDSVGDAIGSGQKILASPIESSGAGTAIESKSALYQQLVTHS
jgi:hypothetical protein